METIIKDALSENNLIEVQELLADRTNELTDGDVATLSDEFKLDLHAAAGLFVSTYGGNSTFIRSLKGQQVRKPLTLGQVRAALNVMQRDIKAGRIQIARKDGRTNPVPVVANPLPTDPAVVTSAPEEGQEFRDEGHRSQCYTCKRWFSSFDAVMAHKTVVHSYYGKKAVAVLKDEEVEETNLDLSALPDGRYAVEDPTGKNDWLFLSVKTVKRRTYMDRKYRCGKFRVGHEWIEAGTIQVRSWSQDAKKLVGQQRPGQGYRGEFVDQLIEIMESPKFAAKIFSKEIGCCAICGKTLTDEKETTRDGLSSRQRGIGPDCFDKWGYNYFRDYRRDRHLDELVEKGILPAEEREKYRAAEAARKAAYTAAHG